LTWLLVLRLVRSSATSENLSRNATTMFGTISSAAVETMPILNLPIPPRAAFCTRSTACLALVRVALASGRNTMPASVSLTVRRSRRNNWTPSSSSSLCICSVRADCERCSSFAERTKLSCSATATNDFRFFNSIFGVHIILSGMYCLVSADEHFVLRNGLLSDNANSLAPASDR